MMRWMRSVQGRALKLYLSFDVYRKLRGILITVLVVLKWSVNLLIITFYCFY